MSTNAEIANSIVRILRESEPEKGARSYILSGNSPLHPKLTREIVFKAGGGVIIYPNTSNVEHNPVGELTLRNRG